MALAVDQESFGNKNYLKSLEKIREENGGTLPSDLYLQTNEQLTALLYDLTGKIAPARTAKKVLVARIERATGASEKAATTKRKIDDSVDDHHSNKKMKVPRGCLGELTAGQISEMKRILRSSSEAIEVYTHRELMPMWSRMGVTSKYPPMTAKAKVVAKMKDFATKNLEFHGML